jgi:nucleoid-associated protein YgaU
MSVATEFPPDVHIPAAARPRSLRVLPPTSGAAGQPDGSAARSLDAYFDPQTACPVAPAAAAIGAEVVDLDRWRHQIVGAQVGGRRRNATDLRIRPEQVAAPLRLTRRGLAVLALASALLAVAVVAIAWVSASHAAGSAGAANAPAVVTVHSGDSLWSIAATVAPNGDPRAEVAKLQALNHLAGDTVTPGQQLRLH